MIVAAWFALAIRQAIDSDRAGAIISSSAPLTHGRAAHAAALLHSAGQLNPDKTVQLLHAQLIDREGHTAAAERLALQVANSEPQNYQAWATLFLMSTPHTGMWLVSFAHMQSLEPPLKQAR